MNTSLKENLLVRRRMESKNEILARSLSSSESDISNVA
jgi:hypothetical protein